MYNLKILYKKKILKIIKYIFLIIILLFYFFIYIFYHHSFYYIYPLSIINFILNFFFIIFVLNLFHIYSLSFLIIFILYHPCPYPFSSSSFIFLIFYHPHPYLLNPLSSISFIIFFLYHPHPFFHILFHPHPLSSSSLITLVLYHPHLSSSLSCGVLNSFSIPFSVSSSLSSSISSSFSLWPPCSPSSSSSSSSSSVSSKMRWTAAAMAWCMLTSGMSPFSTPHYSSSSCCTSSRCSMLCTSFQSRPRYIRWNNTSVWSRASNRPTTLSTRAMFAPSQPMATIIFYARSTSWCHCPGWEPARTSPQGHGGAPSAGHTRMPPLLFILKGVDE